SMFFGKSHPIIAEDIRNIGLVFNKQGKLEDAKKCYERALMILEKRLGKDHPNAVLVRNNLKSLQENN
ncbi:MAG: tetratricopeptide repeat protein, partial [Methanothrix sp.]